MKCLLCLNLQLAMRSAQMEAEMFCEDAGLRSRSDWNTTPSAERAARAVGRLESAAHDLKNHVGLHGRIPN